MRKLDAAGNTATAERTKPQYVTAAQFAALTPNDGDECYLIADATNGVIWHFRYNAGSASAYKWEFIGGPPLSSDVFPSSTTTSTTYVDPVGGAPSLTLPRGGDFEIEHGTFLETSVAAATASVFMAANIGGSAPVDQEGTSLYSNNFQIGMSVAKKVKKTALASGAVVKLQFKISAGTAYTAFAWLRILPVRIS